MSIIPNGNSAKVTVPELLQRKSQAADSTNKKKITCLTAYDYPTAHLMDEAGVDGVLVVADMPFGTYQGDVNEALKNAVRFVKEAGAEAVKVEGGERRLEVIARLTEAEIPVMGHVGLTPQSVHAMGGYRVQGKTERAAEQLLRDARAVEAAGAFSIVLEGIPRELAAEITKSVRVPTIGIGAGPDCDGQILVLHDLLGLTFQEPPKFARRYANIGEVISQAVREYCEDVQGGAFT